MMVKSQLLVLFFCLISVGISVQSPQSTASPINGQSEDLLENLRKIAEKITGDPNNLDKLTQQLKQISADNQNLAKLIESQMVTAKPLVPDAGRQVSESSQPGTNPLIAVQSRLNFLLESMGQLFANMRKVFERVPVPPNSDINPLKALQSLESQFQSMMNGLRVNNPLVSNGQVTTNQPIETSSPSQ